MRFRYKLNSAVRISNHRVTFLKVNTSQIESKRICGIDMKIQFDNLLC